MRDDLEEILLSETQIQTRLDELGRELERDYAGRDLTMIAVLTGSVLFAADLLRRLSLQVRLDCLGISSYHGQTQSAGEVTITKALQLDVRGR
ncbi:MAG: phosphoribosyltransferase family protein, partial [Verrucomicrobiota bacterium]